MLGVSAYYASKNRGKLLEVPSLFVMGEGMLVVLVVLEILDYASARAYHFYNNERTRACKSRNSHLHPYTIQIFMSSLDTCDILKVAYSTCATQYFAQQTCP